MKVELSPEEREALEHLLWCVNNDMPTRMMMEKMLRSVVKYRDDALYSRIYRMIDHVAYRRYVGVDLARIEEEQEQQEEERHL